MTRSVKLKWRNALSMAGAAVLLAVAGTAGAQQALSADPVAANAGQPSAGAILTRMAAYLGSAQAFSVDVRSSYDAVQADGQKIEFGDARKVTLSRPDRLRIEGERSDGARSLTVFNGKEIVLLDERAKVYATAPQPGSLDETIVHFVRDLGMRLPLAVLLVSQLPKEMNNRVRSVEYVEKTTIHGAPAHHLAARTDTVDFQVWVADGERPLPQRVVITYREAEGAPQFRAQFHDWNLAPAISDATYSAPMPPDAQKVAFAAQLAKSSPVTGKPQTKGGAKQ